MTSTISVVLWIHHTKTLTSCMITSVYILIQLVYKHVEGSDFFLLFSHVVPFCIVMPTFGVVSKYIFITMDIITDPMDMSLVKLWQMVKDRNPDILHSMGSQRVGRNWMIEKQKAYLDKLTTNILLFVWLYVLRGISQNINQ